MLPEKNCSIVKKIVFIFFLIPCIAIAQLKEKNCYTVYINYPDHSIRATVFSKDKKLNVNRSLTYYWYSSNKILETTGGYDGKILNGTYTAFYLNGNLKEKGVFKKGIKNRTWIAWYENGKIKEVVRWRNGLLFKIASFNGNGQIASEKRYRKGKMHGYQKLYTDGQVSEKKRYRNGTEIIKKVKQNTEEQSAIVADEKRSIREKAKTLSEKIKILIRDPKTKKKEKAKERPANRVTDSPAITESAENRAPKKKTPQRNGKQPSKKPDSK